MKLVQQLKKWFRSLFAHKTAAERKRLIAQALDHALVEVAGTAPFNGREATGNDARKAVQASTMACPLVASAAEEFLQQNGVHDIYKHDLGGHWVLKDRRTKLLYDLECYTGCQASWQLPSAERAELFLDETMVAAYFEARWLQQRKDCLEACFGGPRP